MTKIHVATAERSERRAIENLVQLYTHDFSEQWAGTDRGEVDGQGRFAPYPLDAYWTDSSHAPFMIRSAERLVGFALLNQTSHVQRHVDRNVAEFFVLRKYRGGRVGTCAAHMLFAAFPGCWEASIARKNAPALAFWRNVVATYPGIVASREHDVNSRDWNGPVLAFEVSS